MHTPSVSIIVPVYKVEQYLDRCVKSLLSQKQENIEIILVDDGSPDSCPLMCDEFAKKDSRVVVVHKENGGLSDARNAGIKEATGDYVMFVDSDDYIDSDAVSRMIPFMNMDVDVIVTDGITHGAETKLTHMGIENSKVYTGNDFVKSCVVSGHIPMAAWLYIYKRSFLEDNNLRFKKGIFHEDEEFTPRALLLATSVVNTGEAYYHYIVRNNSITTKKDKRKNAEDLYHICSSLCDIYDKLEDDELKLYLKDLMVNKYLSLFQDGRLYIYGRDYLHKDFIKSNAYKKRTKQKAFLYNISPRLYWYVNSVL